MAGMMMSCKNVPLVFETPDIGTVDQKRCEADPNFVFITAGEFTVGSDRAERDYAYRLSAQVALESREASDDRIARFEQQLRDKRWFEGEPSKQTQTLPDFCMSRNLATNQEYQIFVSATGHRAPGISEADYQEQGFLVHPYAEVQPYLWKQMEYPTGEGQHPVVLVSYEDAKAYATWKGMVDDRVYRLPMATEWEKVARGGDDRYFPWGNDWQSQGTNAASSGLWHTSKIGAFPLSRSPYEVDDMAGNVFEFTSTLRQRNDRTVSVMKGCSWDDLAGFCRGAYQHTRPIESRHILFGFRLVWVD